MEQCRLSSGNDCGYTGKRKILLFTDESWEYARDLSFVGNRVTGYETNYLEDVDSNLSYSEWKKVSVKDADYTFADRPLPAVSVYEKKPVLTEKRGNGLFIDFGEEITASLKIRAKGSAGNQVMIHCGEECNADGSVRWRMRCNCNYEEIWTLKQGNNQLEQYDYKGFRYAELLSDNEVSVEEVTAVVRHYPFPENAAKLETDQPILRDIFKICKNAVKYGSQESYIDCSTREKGQYSGDLVITGASQLLLTGDPSLLRRAIEAQVDSLRFCPGMTAVAPGSFVQEIADYSLQFPLSVWRYYQYTGDVKFLKSMLEPCYNILHYFKQYERKDGLLEEVAGKWNVTDWPKNLRDDYDFQVDYPVGKGAHNVINAFYAGFVKMLEQMESELGMSPRHCFENLKDSFNHAFFREKTGLYADSETSHHSSLHANCIAAFYGLTPSEYTESVGNMLVNRGMACGVYMAFFRLKALARIGRYRDVWNILVSQDKNSWYNMIKEGATTCFEAWGAGSEMEYQPVSSLGKCACQRAD